MTISKLLTGLVLAGGLVLPGLALAQGAAPVVPTDTKTIGSWTVRCYPNGGPRPCDMSEVMQDKNTGQRVLGISFAFDPMADRHVVQIAVPLGVAIQSGIVIKAASFTSEKMPYRRCDNAGCYVEMIIPNQLTDTLAQSGNSSTVNIAANAGKVVPLPLSLDGFAAAHDAMMTLARQKAKPTEAPKP